MLWTIIGIMVFIILLIRFLPLWISIIVGIIVFPLEIIAFLINKREEKRRIEENKREYQEFLRQQKLKENHQNEQNLLPNESEESENNLNFWFWFFLGIFMIFSLVVILHQ
ncbi:hypothetical protein [Campylobacter cuniculorum]|uniref:hypothetical protein n=1 Tax=Campylobacter cuniculorum TaxID=374106 RepID=UPI0023F1256A|nr:hypothetical protein [Campylobacter cuniculorum]